MSKQVRIGFIIALAVLLTFPVGAVAGGFGLFKRCRPQPQACCPPPVPEPVSTGWGGQAWGTNDTTMEYRLFTEDCSSSNTSPNDVFDALSTKASDAGFTVYSASLTTCSKIAAPKPQQAGTLEVASGESKSLTDLWVGFARLGNSSNAMYAEGENPDEVIDELQTGSRKTRIQLVKVN